MKHRWGCGWGLLDLAARGVVDPVVAVAFPVEDFACAEEEAEFLLGGFGAIAAVDEVEGVADAEVAADGAGVGLAAEGGAHHVAGDGDGAVAADGEDEDGAAGHEADQAGVEGAFLVCAVVGRGEVLADLHQLATDDLKALLFEAADNAAHEAALDGVGLENNEGGFHGPIVRRLVAAWVKCGLEEEAYQAVFRACRASGFVR